VVLADFGVAELVGGAPTGSSAAIDSPAGTPLYLAPEQFHGASASPRTDLYAAGAIVWEMATGRSMRSQLDLLRGAHRPAALPPDAAATLGPPLAALTAALTAPDPAARPATADEALAALGG
jgi:serine/threonine-protein kinase